MDIRHYLTSAHILKGTCFFHYNLHVLPPTLIWLPPHISGSPLSDLGQWELSGRRSGGLISLLIGWSCLVGVITHPLWRAMGCHCSTGSSIKVWTLRTSTHANILQIWILVMCRSSIVHSERCEQQSLIFNVWPLGIRRCDNFLNGYQVKKSFIMPFGLYKRSRSFRRNIIPFKPHWVCTKDFLYDDAHDDDQRRSSSNSHQTHPLTKYTGCLWSFLCVYI